MASSHEESTHPTPAVYAKIAVTLALITAAEVAILYIESLRGLIIPIFVVMSTIKFAMVAMFYMHLKFDNKLFTLFFVSGLALATGVIFALLILFGALGEGRYGSPEVVTDTIAHGSDAHSSDAHSNDHGRKGTSAKAETTASHDSSTTSDRAYTKAAVTSKDLSAASTMTIEIGTKGDQLFFDQETMSGKAGDHITVKLVNSAGAQQHNWVLVPAGPARLEIATAGMIAATTGWIPSDDRIVAHTDLINPGESGEVTFQVPSEGKYEFVCTFPGHSFTMFGAFEITQ